jgi:hypothetical protein
MLARLLVGAFLVACTSPSLACDNYPDLPPLPGEPAEANRARNDRLYESLSVIGHYEAQKDAFKKAARIYLARVLQRESLSPGTPLFSIRVEPVHEIKGKAPPPGARLSDVGYNSCGRWGGGEATNALAGEWVIVFEGLPKGERNPQGVYSIRADDALISGLLEQVEKFSLARGGLRP